MTVFRRIIKRQTPIDKTSFFVYRGYAPKTAEKFSMARRYRVEIFCVLCKKYYPILAIGKGILGWRLVRKICALQHIFDCSFLGENGTAAKRIFVWPPFYFFAFELGRAFVARLLLALGRAYTKSILV